MGVHCEESDDLLEVASKCDVVYQTHIQRETFGERVDLYEESRGKYIVDLSVLNAMQKHTVVMRPLPRLDEAEDIVSSSLACMVEPASASGCKLAGTFIYLARVWYRLQFSTQPNGQRLARIERKRLELR
ncbi:hypothetical protein FXO38_14460 [Capsicum annuum]|nr:hypothetical protein FXO38_14460 [Capsicum annuum]KAF3682330.1 hypothetical protein FXO37_02407 [Capsicum annuum]